MSAAWVSQRYFAAVIAALTVAAYMLVFPPSAYAGATYVARQNADGSLTIRAVYEVFTLMCDGGFLKLNGEYLQTSGTQVADPANPRNLQPQAPCSQLRGVDAVGTDGDDVFKLLLRGFAALGGVFDPTLVDGLRIFDSEGDDTVEIDGRGDSLRFVYAGLRRFVDPMAGEMSYGYFTFRRPFAGRALAARAQTGASLPRLVVRFGSKGGTLNAASYPSPITAIGGSGRDRLVGGLAADRLSGGGGADTLIGGRGNDVLNGGPGNDDLNGGPGNDVLNGGPGNDVLIGGPGRDTGNGGPGRDTARGVEVRRGIP